MRSWKLIAVVVVAMAGASGCIGYRKTVAVQEPAAVVVKHQVPERAAGTTLRAVSFNILTSGNEKFPWEERREAVVDCLRDMDPDVFGLQEAMYGQLEYLMDQMPGYTCIGRGRDDGHKASEFMALFYRTNRFVLKKAEVFWLSDTPDVPGSNQWKGACVRCATVAVLLDRTDGTTVGVCDTHFDHINATARENSGRLVRERLPAYGGNVAWVILGDFNTTPGSPPYVALVDPSRGKLQLTDTFAAANPSAPPDVGSFHGYRGAPGKNRIDWILCGAQFKPLAAGINQFKYRGRFPTDHFPVWADLQREK